MDINELRVSALRRLMGGLSQAEFAEKYDLNASYISQILSGHRSFGERAATNMEKKIGLPVGTLSRPPVVEEHGVGEGSVHYWATQSNVEPGPDIKGQVPLISWVQAGSWCEVEDLYAVGDAEEWMPCPTSHGPRTYALRVRGESMFNPHERRSFRDGDIIFVDPDKVAENGSPVIAKLDDSQEATFKQLVIEGEERYLKALNPNWPDRIIRINGNATICGVVIGKYEVF